MSAGADVNAFAAGGIYPLHDAVECDHVEIVRLLLAYGADCGIPLNNGTTPLKLCHSKKMRFLLRGFIHDLNAETPSSTTGNSDKDKEAKPVPLLPWKFSAIRPPRKYAFDVFEDPPPEADEEDPHQDDEIIIEESDRPICPTFSVRLSPGQEGKVVARLVDVVVQLRTTKEELEKQVAVFSVDNFESRAVCNQLLSRVRRLENESRPTEVVIWEDVRSLMGVNRILVT